MQGGVLELARQAAARADQGRRARGGGAGRLPAVRRRYRGVMQKGDRYVAEIMDADGLRPLFLGSYATPEEAAYAYDAAARVVHGDKAKPNFPEPPPQPQPPAVGAGGARAAGAGAGVLPLLGHARMRVRQTFFSVPQAPPGLHFGEAATCGAAPAFSHFIYRSGAGSAITAAAAAGGSNGGGFFGMAPMIGAEPEVPMTTYAARTELSSSDNRNNSNKAVVDGAADPKPLVIIIESDDEPVVEDNFTAGASTSSSAARPAVPPLRLKDLMEADVVRRIAEEGAP